MTQKTKTSRGPLCFCPSCQVGTSFAINLKILTNFLKIHFIVANGFSLGNIQLKYQNFMISITLNAFARPQAFSNTWLPQYMILIGPLFTCFCNSDVSCMYLYDIIINLLSLIISSLDIYTPNER